MVTVISGLDGTGKNKTVDKLLESIPDYVEFKPEEFSKRDVVHLYASECEQVKMFQHKLYQNRNNIQAIWVTLEGIRVRESDIEKKLEELTVYQQYTILFAFFIVEHFRHQGRTIVVREFALGGDDMKVLDMLDFLRDLVIHCGLNFILTTSNTGKASLAGRKFSFLESDYNAIVL